MPFDYGKKLPDGQHERHPGLEQARELPKIRPVRDIYLHTTCSATTRMPAHCAETYAVNPRFYSETFCSKCGDYFPVDQFRWLDDDSVVGS